MIHQTRLKFSAALCAALSVVVTSPGLALTTTRTGEYFANYDVNGDSKIDSKEWLGRGNFERLDENRDGFIDLGEFQRIYENSAVLAPEKAIAPQVPPTMDISVGDVQVSPDTLSREMRCAITRSNRCPDGQELAQSRGLIETGLTPSFPKKSFCQGVDETFAMSYSEKRGREASHGGIDIPADFNVPILAAANGTVVGIFSEQDGLARGRTVVLRHTPEDTGLTVWTYTEYAHLNEMPDLVVGQRIKMGEVLGPTGNSGNGVGGKISRRNLRRPAIHYAVYYANGPRYAVTRSYVIPEDGHWMDPIALYRSQAPIDSQSLAKLPPTEKSVLVPVVFTDGKFSTTQTKVIWPYPCQREPQ
jgi:murein DD-endopeptidase MepM/ murein hydrolase activator NlpD